MTPAVLFQLCAVVVVVALVAAVALKAMIAWIDKDDQPHNGST